MKIKIPVYTEIEMPEVTTQFQLHLDGECVLDNCINGITDCKTCCFYPTNFIDFYQYVKEEIDC